MTKLKFRSASLADVPRVIEMLADDELGKQREECRNPLPDEYYRAFKHIDEDPNNDLIVANWQGDVVGVVQVTYIPYLTYKGGWRALIEGVRIARDYRSRGFGRALFEHAISRAIEKQCHMVQLTSDKKRPEAIRFYKELGFIDSHEGMKLHLKIQQQ